MANKSIKPLILIFGILTFFIFIISFTVFYTTENFSMTCGCSLPPWVIIVSMASLGLFVGISTYYVISNNYLKEKKEIEKNIIKFLDILDVEEGNILKKIIDNGGEINQSSLSKSLDLGKVKMSRIVSKMEEKNILKKEKNGMTNKLILETNLKKLFVE